MKPHIHAQSSAKKYGGKFEDYLDIHEFMDFSKSMIPDARHRVIMHHTGGCFLVEQAFGSTRVNSAGKIYSIRDIAEQHVIEDLGFIPTLQDYFDPDGGGCFKLKDWMAGTQKNSNVIID